MSEDSKALVDDKDAAVVTDNTADTAGSEQYFIVPVKLLAAITIQGKESDVNEQMRQKVQTLVDSEKVKTALFQASQEFSKEFDDGSFIFVPGLIMPVEEKEDADIAINFVKELNDRTAKSEANDTTNEQPAPDAATEPDKTV